MEITIDGKPADIILEKEKNLGEFLEGIGEWLAGSGYSLSALRVNGKAIGAAALGDAFGMPLADIRTLDIATTGLPLLMAEALADTAREIAAYGNAPFEEQRRIERAWAQSPAASFLAERIPDLFDQADRAFRGEGLSPASLASLAEERIRELREPLLELGSMEGLVEATAKRLEDLPLDIQTGKDGRAAETVQLFSNIAEKLFRLFSLLKLEGGVTDALLIDAMPSAAFIDDFSAALKELLAAYEAKDAVLVGDLAEYELAPRLRAFYSAIKSPASAA